MTPFDDKPVTKFFFPKIGMVDVIDIVSDGSVTTCKVKVGNKVYPKSGEYSINKSIHKAIGEALILATQEAEAESNIQ